MKAPEQIWIDSPREGAGFFYDPLDEKSVNYTRADVAQAMVAAAYEAAAGRFDEIARHDQEGIDYSHMVGIPICNSADLEKSVRAAESDAKAIRDLTLDDARAALDRIIAEAVREALQVKPLVWGYHPMGKMASTGMGTAYIIDTRDAPRIRWGKWPGGHGPERETLAEMQHAAQADYEARILAALKGGEA